MSNNSSNNHGRLTSTNENILSLSLDEYYDKYVAPASELGGLGRYPSQSQVRRHYQRTHYFGPGYLQQRCPRQPGPNPFKKENNKPASVPKVECKFQVNVLSEGSKATKFPKELKVDEKKGKDVEGEVPGKLDLAAQAETDPELEHLVLTIGEEASYDERWYQQ